MPMCREKRVIIYLLLLSPILSIWTVEVLGMMFQKIDLLPTNLVIFLTIFYVCGVCLFRCIEILEERTSLKEN